MTVEFLRQFCKTLPGVTEDIKWENDLCFLVGGKMFCVTGLDGPFSASFKVKDDEFDEISSREGFMPAPYLARAKWVYVNADAKMKKKEWEMFVRQSYDLIKSRLPKKIQKELES
jgi:predicted DNA-binding protein (MmcQ/YjbR family)